MTENDTNNPAPREKNDAQASSGNGKQTRRPKRKHRIVVLESWCKRCGICAAFCPKKVFTQETEMPPAPEFADRCTGCRLCVLRCPDFAVLVMDENDDEENEKK